MRERSQIARARRLTSDRNRERFPPFRRIALGTGDEGRGTGRERVRVGGALQKDVFTCLTASKSRSRRFCFSATDESGARAAVRHRFGGVQGDFATPNVPYPFQVTREYRCSTVVHSRQRRNVRKTTVAFQKTLRARINVHMTRKRPSALSTFFIGTHRKTKKSPT